MAENNGFAYAEWVDSFSSATFQFYCSGKKDMETGKYLSAIVWSAVFVESLLKDILSEFEIDCENMMLNALIGKTRAIVEKGEELSKEDKKRIRDILDRCDSIRKSRNFFLHDNGIPKYNIEQEARSVYELHLDWILRLYVQTEIAKAMEIRNSQPGGQKSASCQNFRIFVSTITPFTFEQAVFIESFCKRLARIGAVPVRCRPKDFGTKRPMEVVRKMIDGCDAVVVLGLEKYYVHHYVEKMGTSKQTDIINTRFSSEWLQIESGIAVGLDKKLFALHQKNLHKQGIFDHDWNSIRPMEMQAGLDARCSEVDTVLNEIIEYMEECKGKQ